MLCRYPALLHLLLLLHRTSSWARRATTSTSRLLSERTLRVTESALGGTRGGRLLGEPTRRRPMLPHPGLPHRAPPRPDPPVVCPGFGIDESCNGMSGNSYVNRMGEHNEHANAHRMRRVHARVRTRSAPCERVRTLAEWAVCARSQAGRSGPAFLALRVRVEPVSNGATSLGRQGCRASPAAPAAHGACTKLEPRGGQKLSTHRAEK